jgi:iron complex outermembrane receptor protein
MTRGRDGEGGEYKWRRGAANLRLGSTQNIGNWTLTKFARVDSLFDKEYIGSVRVNNAAYIEAARTRNGFVGITARYNF